jgi:hypothetical protein
MTRPLVVLCATLLGLVSAGSAPAALNKCAAAKRPVASDLRSFTLEAIDPRGSHATKMVADCPHLSVADGAITTGTLPLQYVDP